jgi:hypothetical protein
MKESHTEERSVVSLLVSPAVSARTESAELSLVDRWLARLDCKKTFCDHLPFAPLPHMSRFQRAFIELPPES